jgi:hypothetical protein
MVVPEALASHEGGRSIGATSPRRLYFATRNHLRLARRVAPAGPVHSFLRGVSIVILNLAHAVRTPGASLADRFRAVVRGTRDHLAGRYGSGA